MRICFVSSASSWGGGERLLASLIDGLADLGQDLAIACCRDSPTAEWAHKQQGLQIFEQSGRGRSPWCMWQLRKWLAENQFDVIVFNDPHAITGGGVASLGLPAKKVGIRHTVFPIHSAWKHNRLLDHVICVAQAAQEECTQAGISLEKTSVIYAGLEKPAINPANVARLRAMFHNASGHRTDSHLLALGSLLPVKGFDTLISALAAGVRQGQRWRLWLAGTGTEQEALEELAKLEGVADRVHFLGFRKDVGDLLSAADLLVSASHFEGLSLVLIEGMLIGCPLVATPVGGNREALCIDETGKSPHAVAFPAGKTRRLVTALKEGLRRDAADRRAALAQAWAEENFSVSRMAERHLATYRQLVAGSSAIQEHTPQRSKAA